MSAYLHTSYSMLVLVCETPLCIGKAEIYRLQLPLLLFTFFTPRLSSFHLHGLNVWSADVVWCAQCKASVMWDLPSITCSQHGAALVCAQA